MTEQDPARRFRSNALSAATFAPLLDVDPRVVEPLLDSLEDAGIAAYAQPRTHRAPFGGELEAGRFDPALREQLWVDGAQRDLAATVVATELPGLLAELHAAPARDVADADPDEAFAAIVARFADEPAGPVPPWPVSEDVDGSRRAPAAEADEPLVPRPPEDGEAVAEDDDEGHFVPPPPPPLPAAAVRTKLAVAAMVVGFCCMIGLQRFLGFPAGRGGFGFGVLLLVGGAGTLLARMRDDPPADDGSDDGAVV